MKKQKVVVLKGNPGKIRRHNERTSHENTLTEISIFLTNGNNKKSCSGNCTRNRSRHRGRAGYYPAGREITTPADIGKRITHHRSAGVYGKGTGTCSRMSAGVTGT